MPLSIIEPIDSSPSEKETPSSIVGTGLKVLRTSLAFMPFEKGVYLFGSNVSVWAIPPAIQSRMTVSALEFVLLLLQEDNKLVKGRCKGVRPRDTYLIGEYDDESHPFVADRDKVFVCDEEFYSSLCNGEKLSISCDVFKKGIGLDENGKKYFKLCHARMIKVI